MSEQPYVFDGDEVCFCPICGGKVAIATMTHRAYGSLRQISFYCNNGKTECFDAVSKIFPEGQVPWNKIRDAHTGKLDEETLTSHRLIGGNKVDTRVTDLEQILGDIDRILTNDPNLLAIQTCITLARNAIKKAK